MPLLSREERERIAEAVRAAEDGTQGEIVVLVAGRASAYRSVPPIVALAVAMIVPWPLIAYTPMTAGRIALVQSLAILVAVIAALAAVRSGAVPRFMKRARAREAAAREFWSRGVSRTRGRTGILIYVAVAERYAEVVADVAILDLVGEEVWRETIGALVAALGRGDIADGLVDAVCRVAPILAEHVPLTGEPIDELPNRVIVTA